VDAGPDETLLLRSKFGDGEAFGRLVREYQSPLRGFLRRLTRGDAALADDLAQETFLEAWRKIGQKREDGSFPGWLCSIAWSRFLMNRRRRTEEPLENALDGPSIEPEPASAAKLDLEKAMARLAPAERAALTLCFAFGYSHGEAADILGMPLGTLKSHVLRGRERLKSMLEARP
jgi:RNA polymerase sigma-70 factor (ECF subfamily)